MNNINYKRFFKILLDASKLINSSFDLNIALERIIKAVTQSMHCEGSSLLLLNKKTNNLYFKSATGNVAEDIKELKLKMGEGIAGWVAKHRESLLVPDVQKDTRHKKDIDITTGFVSHSIIAAPIEYQGAILGILEAVNPKHKEQFNNEDLILLEALASQVAIAIRYCDAYEKLNQQNIELKKAIGVEQNIIGQSKILTDILHRADKIAPFDVTVLITGESGTGKELLAHKIHINSHRSQKPYIAINCSALPEHLIESELFGHERGAFTGAIATRKGKFETASGGTLFLDEIGDMGLAVQAKILRTLETGIHMRVGSDKPIKTDVRIITATNKDLREMVTKGTFREDLFYRLYEMHLNLPSLRDRKSDIPLLISYFIRLFAASFNKNVSGVTKDSLEILLSHNWPGNIRELKNVIKTSIVMCDGEMIRHQDLPDNLVKNACNRFALTIDSGSLEDIEQQYIYRILRENKWKKSKTAQILKISRPTLDAKIKQYGIKFEK